MEDRIRTYKNYNTGYKNFIERTICMNPVFWLLLFIAVTAAWFAISGLFIPIGRMLIKKWDRLVKDLEEPREEKEIKKAEEKNNE